MPAKWTIIIQISAESNLLFDSIKMFDEMGLVANSEDVNFIVLMDGMHIEEDGDLPDEFREFDYLKNKERKHPTAYKICKDIKYATAKPWRIFEDDNLSDKKNLASVLGQIKKYFEADNYGFIYSGHAGPGEIDVVDGCFVCKVEKVNRDEYDQDGLIKTELIKARIIQKSKILPQVRKWDVADVIVADEYKAYPKAVLVIYKREKGPELKYLSYSCLSWALQKAFPDKLSFVLLDCCWGMMLENVSAFQKSTRFLIGSVDEMPAQGIGYRHLCQSICELPSIKPAELAKLLVAIYYKERYRDYEDADNPENRLYSHMGVSLSCADTKYFEAVLPILKDLIGEVRANMRSNDFEQVLLAAVKLCRDYTYENPMVYNMYNVDLIWFLENMIFQIDNPDHPEYKSKFSRVRDLALQLILQLKLYLMPAFLSNNYRDTKPGTRALGGKGLSITLPRSKQYFEKSFIPDAKKLEFFTTTGWIDMLKEYYDKVESVEKKKKALNLLKPLPKRERV